MKNVRATDIGYGVLKDVDAKGIVCKTRAVVGRLGDSMTPNDTLAADVIMIDGISYVIGDDVYNLGRKPIVANETVNRAQSEAYKVLAMYSLAKRHTVNEEAVTVITGMPYQNLDESDEIKALFNGEHSLTFNGKEITVNVNSTVVVSQGLGTYYTLVKQRGNDIIIKRILVVDLGFKTINYLPIISGEIDALTVKTARELDIQSAYKKIADAVNLEYKTDYKYYHIDDLLDHGVPRQDINTGKIFDPIMDKLYVKDAFDEYAKSVWADLIDKYSGAFMDDLDEVVFGGGTAERVETNLLEHKKHYCTIMDNAQDAQVLGYAEIAKKL
ncbi:ParM/StbA family protein [Paenibacillus macquariensis]|uniref:ParM/StbA family protein n=1 Tax=Paenibacillus macquariensis TaxID=948756 RepID=UPI002DB74D4A|nr:ParM/StbA family protein [Paenibacillus macquariensis]MEC0092521.1 ParM/StbA family protein [Paenibacillus macquariensis]